MLIKKNFSQSRNPFSTNWFILVTITLFLICLRIPEGHCAEKDIQETLHARIKINVTWNIVSGNRINKGFLAVNVNGMLNYNREMSSPTHGLPSVMLTYDPQNMTWSYRYKEEDIGQKPPECPLNEEYHGSGSFSFRQPGQLMVHYLGGLYKGIPLKKTGHPETAGYLTGYYDFSIHPPELTAEGKRRYSSKCSYKPSTRKFNSSLSIRFKMKESGEMSGSRTWTSHWSTGRPTFTIGISDLGTPYKEKPYKPPAEDPGNVTYRVEWRIDKAPAIDIFRETEPDVYVPITNASQEVIVGEKIKLKAVVLPHDESSKGVWEVPPSAISGFVADRNRGKVIILEEEQKREPVIEFFFTDGEFSQGKTFGITYTTEDKKLQGKTTFKVFEPEVRMERRKKNPNIGLWPVGKVQECRLYLGDRGRLPRDTDLRKGQIAPEEAEELNKRAARDTAGIFIDSTITLPMPFSNREHSLEYIQIVKELILDTYDGYSYCTRADNWLCDKNYPYAKKVAEKTIYMDDSPGSPLSVRTDLLNQYQTFQTFLMFRPCPLSKAQSDENSVWVPLKVVEWEWKASAKRVNPSSNSYHSLPEEFRRRDLIIPSPENKDWGRDVPPIPASYPQWDGNVEPESGRKKQVGHTGDPDQTVWRALLEEFRKTGI
jgi:hypothetical protein